MRKLILSNFVSLDGFIEGPNQELDWHNVNDEFLDYALNMLNDADIILFGRKTYEMMAAYWPTENVVANDPLIANKMNSLEKIVFSTTLDKVEWNNSRLIKQDIVNEIQHLKQQPGKDILLLGSASIVSALMQAGLIDECRMIINPVILGGGTPFFSGIKNRINLQLAQTMTFGNATILLNYHPKQ